MICFTDSIEAKPKQKIFFSFSWPIRFHRGRSGQCNSKTQMMLLVIRGAFQHLATTSSLNTQWVLNPITKATKHASCCVLSYNRPKMESNCWHFEKPHCNHQLPQASRSYGAPDGHIRNSRNGLGLSVAAIELYLSRQLFLCSGKTVNFCCLSLIKENDSLRCSVPVYSNLFYLTIEYQI